MAALACVYDAAPAPRRPHDVTAVPGGRSDQRDARHGPHATARWLTGSVAAGADQVIAAAFGQAEARDPAHQRTWVVLAGGDRHQIKLAQAEAARRKVAIASSPASCTSWSYPRDLTRSNQCLQRS